MKQISQTYAKALAIYYLSVLVCSLLLCLFYYFNIVSSSIFMYSCIGLSSVFCLLSFLYLQKSIQKKTLLHLIGYLLILLVVSLCTMPFLHTSFWLSSIKSSCCFLIALFVFLRK